MNKKMILFAALVAASSAAFISCSSSDDDVLPQATVAPAAEETVVPDTNEVQGTPMVVRIQNGSTSTSRADLTLKINALPSFKLWAVQQTDPKVRWLNGVVFTGNNTDGWTASGAVWPTTNKTTATNFYGYADFSDLTGTDVPGIDTEGTMTTSAQSFTYTLGTGASSTLNYSPYTNEEIQEMASSGDEDDEDEAAYSLTKTATETVYNVEGPSTLPDLLVTKDDQQGTEGTDGTFSLALQHALSGLAIKARFTTSTSGSTWVANTTYYIEWIRVYGLYTSGIYTFGAGWTNTGTDGKVVYQKFFGMGENALKVNIQDHNTLSSGVNYTYLVEPGEFMVLPQEAQTFTPNGATAPSGVYLEFAGFTKRGTVKNFVHRLHYLPLNVKNNEFRMGKVNTVVVDMTQAVYDNGAYCATPAEVGGSGSRLLNEDFNE